MKLKLVLITIILILGTSTVLAENNQTFLDIQNAINTDSNIIYLNNSHYFGEGNPITIDRDVIIDGSSENKTENSILNANSLSRIFNIKNTNTVVLKNLILINGRSDAGGAIMFNSTGDLIICNCNFEDNEAIYGSSIYNYGRINLYDGHFTNNNPVDTLGTIYSENNEIYMTNSYFDNNNPVKSYLINGEIEKQFNDESIISPINTELGLIGNGNYYMLKYNPQFNGEYPSKYDLRDYGFTSPIYNQGSTGTCWAQAALATLQSCILKACNGNQLFLESDKFSAENLLNVLIDNIRYCDYRNGGYFEDALPYFTSWMGPVYEKDDPWVGYYKHSDIMNSAIHVQNAYNLPARNNYTDIEPLKRALMDYGAVYTTCYSGDYCHNEYGDYYNPIFRTANHAVTIVGYDDTYSRYNFNPYYGQYPEGDGAFIVQNSWGSSWGRNGYFYVSYYDESIYKSSERAWTFIFNDTLRYDKNYQNEVKGKGTIARVGTSVTLQNTFTSEDDDYLVAFSTYFTERCNYEAKIYVNNELKLVQTGLNDVSGYYTLEFDKYIPLKKDDEFSVQLTYSSLNEDYIHFYMSLDQRTPAIKAFTSKYLFESIQNKINYAKNNSEIFLDNKTYYASENEKTIVVNKNIIINGAKSNGEGYSTLDACDLISIFKIEDGCSVVFKKLNLINSKEFAINSTIKSNMDVINLKITNNEGKYAIYILGNGTISNSSFNNDLMDIYISGHVTLENNKMNNGIYNNGTILSNSYLKFSTNTTNINNTVRLIATLYDDNHNNIVVDTLNIENIGNMAYNNKIWYLDHIPQSSGEYVLTPNIKGFYNLTIDEGLLTVKKERNPVNINITCENTTYGSNTAVIVQFTPGATGKLELYINNELIQNTSLNGDEIKIKLPQLQAGKYSLKAIYNGDANYLNQTKTINITIDKSPSKISYEKINETQIKVLVPNDNQSSLNIKINNETYPIEINGNIGIIDLKNLDAGNYNFTISYNSQNYVVEDLGGFIVIKETYELIVDDIEMYYKDGTKLKAKLVNSKGNPISGSKVTITINGENYGRTTQNNGEISMDINLKVGEYVVTLTSQNKTITANILVKSTIIGTDLVKYFHNSSNYQVKIINNNGKPASNIKLNLNINGVIYTRTTNNQGIANMNINLGPGNYTLTVENTANNEMCSNKIEVLPTLIGKDIIKYYKNGTNYIVKLLDDQGNPLSGQTINYNINGVFYTRTTNSEGIANFTINLIPGTYIITTFVNDCIISNNITVLPTIKSTNLEMTTSKRTAFKIIALDDAGMVMADTAVSFNINGVLYPRITKSDGSASLNINLMAGKYIITTSHNGLLTSNTITIREN